MISSEFLAIAEALFEIAVVLADIRFAFVAIPAAFSTISSACLASDDSKVPLKLEISALFCAIAVVLLWIEAWFASINWAFSSISSAIWVCNWDIWPLVCPFKLAI